MRIGPFNVYWTYFRRWHLYVSYKRARWTIF